MEIQKDRQDRAVQQAQYHTRLLDVLCKYFDSDKNHISLQTICDDVCFLSGASFCIINTLNDEMDHLKTICISHNTSTDRPAIKLLNKKWDKRSFIFKLTEAKKLSVTSAEDHLKEFGLDSPLLFHIGLNHEGNNYGSVIFGTGPEKELEAGQSTEYFITQAEKLIPRLLKNKYVPEKYYKSSEIIKKNDTDLIFVVDRQFNIIDANTIFLHPVSHNRMNNILSFVPGNLKKSFSKSLNDCFATGHLAYEELPLHIDARRNIFYVIKFIPIKKGEVIDTVCVVATDTEEQKHILRDFNILQNFASIGWWEVYMPSYKILWSEGLYGLLELDPFSVEPSDEIYLKYIHPDDAAYVEGAYKQALKEGKSQYEITYRFVMNDGRIKWVTDKCITYYDDDGNQCRSLGIIQEITQLKNTEIELKKINDSYQRLNDQVPGVIFEYQIFSNGERRFNSISEKGIKGIGISEEEPKQDTTIAWDKIHPADLEILKKAFSESARTLKRLNVDYRVTLPEENNRVSWKRIEATPEKQKDNSRIWYGYISEIDEMKEAQLEILEAKEEAERANKAKTEFLANMSHEIRTPLNAVLGFSELLKGNTKGPKYEGYIDGILSGGKNLLSLIDDILDLSKIEAGQMNIQNVSVNVEKLVHEFRQLFAQKAREKNIEFLIHVGDDLPKNILIDETRIRQVLFNLLGNAFKFTHQGSVTLSVSILENTSDQNNISLVFKVIDTGIGIPESQHRLIFESFKQQDGQSNRKYGGTGLGLAITRRLVDMMNGAIHLVSAAGKGSVFSVIIQDIQIASTEEAEEGNHKNSNYVFNAQKILLVEDVRSNREIIKGFLEPMNLQIIMAEDGQEALNLLSSDAPDLILMDMMMPVMDGYTAIKIIRGKGTYDAIPIIALTASALKQSEIEIRELCNDYLRKPVSKKDLLFILSKYLTHQIIKPKDQTSITGMPNDSLPTGFTEELKQDLRTLFLPRWKEVTNLMSIDDIVNFAISLNAYAAHIKSKDLETYCRNLLNHAENFDIDKMNTLFYAFVTLLKGPDNE